jgi:hypothetical protein
MKKLKREQQGPWCSYCPEKSNRARYREDGFRGVFSCDKHSSLLLDHEHRVRQEDERITLADESTWTSI